jgi:hypothetical protein
MAFTFFFRDADAHDVLPEQAAPYAQVRQKDPTPRGQPAPLEYRRGRASRTVR